MLAVVEKLLFVLLLLSLLFFLRFQGWQQEYCDGLRKLLISKLFSKHCEIKLLPAAFSRNDFRKIANTINR